MNCTDGFIQLLDFLKLVSVHVTVEHRCTGNEMSSVVPKRKWNSPRFEFNNVYVRAPPISAVLLVYANNYPLYDLCTFLHHQITANYKSCYLCLRGGQQQVKI